MSAPDVIVGWLQRDYGTLGRAGEAIAHALVRNPEVGRVAYLEPFRPRSGEPELNVRNDRGLFVLDGSGTPPVGGHEIARGVCTAAGLTDPILLNVGVSTVNWWLHYELAPVVSRSVLVAYDRLSQWEAAAGQRQLLEQVRSRLVASSDAVCGLSEGSIDDLHSAVYVGHGVDETWRDAGIDALTEPIELAAIPRPRAVYVGALSMRFDADAVGALADAGLQVVLVGMAPQPAVTRLAAEHPRVHLIGERPPEQAAAYLLHSDVGIVPHTAEPFTQSMEPHKAYNYAAAGLPTVTLGAPHAPALDTLLTATGDRESFIAATLQAAEHGRLDAEQITYARSLTWDRVAARILAAAGVTVSVPPLRVPLPA